HPVETVLGPELLKGPMLEARRHADLLSQPSELASLLDRWSAQGQIRRRLLGRQAAMHRVAHLKVYFYTLRVLYETRDPAKSFEEPDRKPVDLPREKELDRWEVALPVPKAFAAEQGGTIRLPGSLQVANCGTCGGERRLQCVRCKGKGRVTVVREAGAAAAGKPDPKATAAPVAAAPPQKTEVVVPCPDCEGTGALKCKACDGVGRMLRHKTTTWSRRAAELSAHDDLPNVDEAWLARTNTPVELYCERHTGGFRAGWDALPVVAELLRSASAPLGDDTRLAMTELSVSFIPLSELVFDLGEQTKGVAVTPKGSRTRSAPTPEPIVTTYNLHVYGFQRSIPNDWRFLNWDRIWALALGIVALVLLVLLVVVGLVG
ncbi:MAG: zinc finger-like domain-containing protein, partial [Roseiflexaceae bacterium]|nr:zinc finger-like domain-containing protein [Roseiflexaceae bacterium]